MRIGFVILHYNVFEETKKCVSSIFSRLDSNDFEIIIVDNASPNASGIALQEEYATTAKVTVILNDTNLGFARGNNVGFHYAKHSASCDFIVMLNNDTYLIQDDFFAVIMDEFTASHFAVLGPEIHTPDNKNPNPIKNTLPTEESVKKKIKHWKRARVRNFFFLEYLNPIYYFFMHLCKKKNEKKQIPQNRRQENVQLHGCCFVFSPEFICRYKGLDDRTFMYLEEDILYAQMRRDKLLMVYNPRLKIYHTEDSATNSIRKSSRKKNHFLYTNYIKSSKVLLSILREAPKDF